MPLKVCHITTVHRADDVRIFRKQCTSLAKAGNQVWLVAPAQGELEELAPVELVPLKKRPSRAQRMLLAPWDAYRSALKTGASVFHFHDPELLVIAPLLRLSGAKVIYDLHEDLPNQIRSKEWIPGLLKPVVAAIAALAEHVSARLFLSHLVAATPKIASRFSADHVTIVRNYPIIDPDAVSKSADPGPAEVVSYIGALTRVRGAAQMVAAAEKLAQRGASLAIAGKFSEPAVEEECRAQPGWSNVDFRGWLGPAEIKALLAESRVGLVLLHPTLSYIDAYPVKLFEYMAAGIPVVASDFPLWRSIIEEADCGVLADPLDVDAIVAAVIGLLDNESDAKRMGANGKAAVLEKYNWGREEQNLLRVYNRLAGETE